MNLVAREGYIIEFLTHESDQSTKLGEEKGMRWRENE